MADYGEAKPAPETLSMLLGKYLGEGAEAVGSLFPPSNPYGQAVKNLLLGDIPETARRLEEGEPYVLMDTRAGRQLIKPEALEVAGFMPVGEVAKGAGLAAKALGAKESSLLGMLGATAYHGTPHRFAPTERNPLGEFDLSKIGSGEGAQSYGHGIYLAENKKVAGGYRNKLGYKAMVEDFLNQLPEDAEVEDALDAAKHMSPERAKVIEALHKDDWLGFDYPAQAITAAFKDLKRYDPSPELKEAVQNAIGSLYTTDVPDEYVGKMLDLDKPIESQSKYIQEKLEPLIAPLRNKLTPSMYALKTSFGGQMMHPSGKYVYQHLVNELGGAKEASEYLNSLGIIGNKYLDALSREAGEGTRNFVLFDPKIADITRREAKGGAIKMKEGGDVATQAREKAAAAWEGLKQMYEEAKDKAASENVLEGLKGTARAYTTDVLGMPADLLASFPVAPRESGNPYANAIRDLQEKVGDVAGSDWLAQKLGLYGEGLAHEAGRMFGPGAVKVFAPEKTISRIFAGERAATADLEAKKLAEKMLEEGAAPEEVWAKTGWGKGPEGKWRFEISDLGASSNPRQYPEGSDWDIAQKRPIYMNLEDALSHQDLYSAYPELRSVGTELRPGMGGGSFRDDITAGYDPKTGKANVSTLLHELQHAAQIEEDFPMGGSPQMAFLPKNKEAFDILRQKRLEATIPMTESEYAKRAWQSDEVIPEIAKDYADYVKSLGKPSAWMDKQIQEAAAQDYYQRLGGEAEARLTQMRANLSPEERRAAYPWNPDYFREKTGVPLEDLIYRYDAEGPSELITYHGTPHRFPATERNPLGEFDASKIGTGEGAQAYGHGIYLAESPGVAGGYRDKLAKNEVLLDGEKVKHDFNATDPQSLGLNALTSEPSPAGAAKALRDAVADPSLWGKGSAYEADLAKQYLAAADWLEKNEKRLKVDSGSFYKVDLPDEMIDRMLDWDKPLSEQPAIQKALKDTDYAIGITDKEAEDLAEIRVRQEADDWAEETGGDPTDYYNNANWDKYVEKIKREYGGLDSSMTGEDFHNYMMKETGYNPSLLDPYNYQVDTSDALRDLGIPGIKYLDAMSRDAGKGTRNFVIFPGEEKNLNILERKARGGAVDYEPDKIARLMAKVLE